MKKRIALLGLYHETNTFLDTSTTFESFKNGYWLVGEDITREYRGAHHEISGIISVLENSGDVELVPVFYASATPAGMILDDAYEALLTEMLRELDKVLPIDGCMVVPHGAGVVQSFPDMDGHWLSALREKIGRDLPVMGTLDPHANVSRAMVGATNALVPYSTNPHIDQAETGRKAAQLMLDYLRGVSVPRQKLIQLPLAISIEQQCTLVEPCHGLKLFVESIERKYNLLSARLLLGFPYADVEEMGSGFVLVSDDDEEACEAASAELRAYMDSDYKRFNGAKNELKSLLRTFDDLPKPILLLDMGDNVGGGAPGDSTHLLGGLDTRGIHPVFCCIYDPEAVRIASAYPLGTRCQLTFGFPRYTVDVTVLSIGDGRFTEDTPRHGGFVNFNMGTIAIVKTKNGNTVMLTSRRCEPYSLRQLTAFGLDPSHFDYIIAKGVNAPIAAYEKVCPSIIKVDSPGPTGADMTRFTYQRRRKPLFPFEEIA